MSEIDELTDEEILTMPITTETFRRRTYLVAEMAEYVLPQVRQVRRRMERLQRRIRRIQKWLDGD